MIEAKEKLYVVLSNDWTFISRYSSECNVCVCVCVQAMTGLECGHMFCLQCWDHYLTTKIIDEGMGTVSDWLQLCSVTVALCWQVAKYSSVLPNMWIICYGVKMYWFWRVRLLPVLLTAVIFWWTMQLLCKCLSPVYNDFFYTLYYTCSISYKINQIWSWIIYIS